MASQGSIDLDFKIESQALSVIIDCETFVRLPW